MITPKDDKLAKAKAAIPVPPTVLTRFSRSPTPANDLQIRGRDYAALHKAGGRSLSTRRRHMLYRPCRPCPAGVGIMHEGVIHAGSIGRSACVGIGPHSRRPMGRANPRRP